MAINTRLMVDSGGEPITQEELDNLYATQQVGTTGKTQAQLDAAANAAGVATATGQKVDPKTGYVVPESQVNLKDKSTPPKAPAGSHYTWIGGTTTGQWQLYKDAPSAGASASSGSGASASAAASTGSGAAKVYTASDGKSFDSEAAMVAYDADIRNAKLTASTKAATDLAERQSAYDLLYTEFSKYGLGSLVTPLKGLITSGASPAEFTIKLRETPEYQARFAGNAQRVANGLAAIDEATYIAKEDAYQNLMRNYGLPDTYWKTGPMGTQEGFTKLIANDVSAVELENRLQTAQQRVLNSNPEVAYTLKAFYPDITNGDILAYALDPKNALDTINRKVTAAEIGGAALAQGLSTSLGGAEGLAAYGITKAQAQQGYQNVAGMVPRGSQLADIYGQQPYNQGTAEAEVFGTAGAADAKKRREKLISLESASFGGSSGVGALGRDKNIYGAAFGQQGQY